MFSVEEDFEHHVYSSVNKVKKVSAKPTTDARDDTLNSSGYGKLNASSEKVKMYEYESKHAVIFSIVSASN